MTKQPPCATALSPSRLCRLLLALLPIKLLVVGLLLIEPASFFDRDTKGAGTLAAGIAEFLSGGRVFSANAATGDGAAAPPAIDTSLPDAGMERAKPEGSYARNRSLSTPGAVPGVSFAQNSTERLPALPPISSRAANTTNMPGSQNGTVAVDRDSLARRQEDLARKEQELRLLEGELGNKLEQMQMLENRLSLMMKEAEGTKDAKFRHMVDMLSNMKSKQAAAVLETLDPKIAVRVLAGMRGRQAGEILTFVKPEIAAKLTESLARMQLPLE